MDNTIFEKLVLQNEQKLYRISMSMLKNEADAQDAVHDAILKAYKNLNSLKKEELNRPSLFFPEQRQYPYHFHQ